MTLSEEAQALLDEMDADLVGVIENDKPEGPLYHYTGSGGLLGIVDEKQIRATNYRFLNDRDELLAGEKLVNQAVAQLAEQENQRTEVAKFCEMFGEIHREKWRLSEIAEVFVASLTERDDQLSQWRAYAAGGAGYSIGFNSFPLPTKENPTGNVAVIMLKCQYNEDQFKARVRHEITGVMNGLRKWAQRYPTRVELGRSFFNVAMSVALRKIVARVPSYKQGAFNEEKEWRIVGIPLPDHKTDRDLIRFHPRPNGLVPYLAVPLAEGEARIDLHDVVIGPTQDPTSGVKATQLFLQSRGYDCPVRPSKIPFRG